MLSWLASFAPDYISDHDGAGALLMAEPDFQKFLAGTIQGASDAVLGRLINGTSLALLEMTEAEEKLVPPWKKVRVLEGKLKDKTGWILADSLRKP